jgi:hypothetical protein
MSDLRPRALRDLEAVARLVGRPPTAREYNERGDYTSVLLAHECGSYEDALEAAGLPPADCPATPDENDLSLAELNRQLDYGESTETLLRDLRRVAERVGHPPTVQEYDANGRFPPGSYCNRFASWFGALATAGFTPENRPAIEEPDLPDNPTPEGGNQVADGTLLADIRRVAEDLGHPPKSQEYASLGKHAQSTPTHRFGSWAGAIERAGLDPFNRPGGKDLPDGIELSHRPFIEDIQRVTDELGHSPTTVEYETHGVFPRSTVCSQFGSWDDALSSAGVAGDDASEPDGEPAAQPAATPVPQP